MSDPAATSAFNRDPAGSALPYGARLNPTAGSFTVAEAAAVLGLTARHVQRLCRTGEIAATRGPAGQWLIPPDAHPALRLARGRPVGPVGIARPDGAPGEPGLDCPALAGLSAAKRATVHARYQSVRNYEAALRHRPAGQTVGQFADMWVAGWNLTRPDGPRLSVPTLYRWRRRLAAGGVAALADGRGYWGPAVCSGAAWDLFSGMYLSQARPHVPRLHQYVAAQAQINGWDWPALRTVQQWVAERLDPKLAALGRQPKKFRDRHNPHIERDWSQVPAMGCWVGDHRQLDVLWPRHLWNARKQRWDWLYARPWLTMFLDARSWMPAAWSICFDSPDGNRVMAAFARGVAAHGRPDRLYLDNGKDFRMVRFAGGRRRNPRRGEKIVPEKTIAPLLEVLGVGVTWALPFNARAKVVEPWFRIQAEQFDKCWETYCGRSPEARPEDLKKLRGKAEAVAAAHADAETMDAIRYRGAPQAVRDRLVLEPLARAFESWITADYARRESPSKAAGGLSAGAAFRQLRADDFAVRRPAAEDLALLLLPSVAVRVEANGVYVRPFGRHYWSDDEEFQRRRGASGRDAARKIVYRYDPDEPSLIYVFDRRGKFLCTAGPYIGEGVHPFAAPGGADADKLEAAIVLQRRTAKAARRRVASLHDFANNHLLLAHAAAGRRDETPASATAAAPRVMQFEPHIAAAAAAGRKQQDQRAARQAARDFFTKTGTDDAGDPPAADAKPPTRAIDLLGDNDDG